MKERQTTKVPEDVIIYSEEVQEIMGHIPHWIVRFGIAFMLSILVLVLVASFFIKVPEIVSAPLVLTTINSPAPLVSQLNGRIEQWYVTNGQQVEAGAYIALIQNNADLSDVEEITKLLEKLELNWVEDVEQLTFPNHLDLGTLRNAYLKFNSTFNELKSYIQSNGIDDKIKFQKKLMQLNKEHLQKMQEQLKIKENKFRISRKIFEQDSVFGEQNKFGIAKRETDLSQKSFLQESEDLIAFRGTLKNAEKELIQKEAELHALSVEHSARLRQYCAELDELFENLNLEMDRWKLSYLVTSPINGKVTFTDFWSPNQVFIAGQQLATVIPTESTSIIGRAFIPSSALGKVEPGQMVNMKLSGFPYLQYGMVMGTIRSVSLVPLDKGYVAEIDLTKGMVSSYSEKLKFVHEMDGVAEIVTGKVRILSKFIRPLNAFDSAINDHE